MPAAPTVTATNPFSSFEAKLGLIVAMTPLGHFDWRVAYPTVRVSKPSIECAAFGLECELLWHIGSGSHSSAQSTNQPVRLDFTVGGSPCSMK
jgi:hypothetical protein